MLSVWLLVALGTTTIGSAIVMLWLERRRRRRRRPGMAGWFRVLPARVLSIVLVLVLSVTTFADYQNRRFAYIPSFAALLGDVSPYLHHGGLSAVHQLQSRAEAAHGAVIKVEVPGPLSGVRVRPAYVYLPAAYFERSPTVRRFPVYYLLHGSPGVAVDWVRGGRLDLAMETLTTEHRIEPFIVVMPDTNGGYARDLECQNSPGGVQDETYLAQDVVHFVDQNLRTIPDRRARAIGGLSTGGYCAVNLAFHHQDTFSVVVSQSGSGRPDHGRYTGNLFGGHPQLRRDNTPDDYLHQLPIRPDMAVYLGTGRTDHWSMRETSTLRKVLQTRRLAVTNVQTAGGHSFLTWSRGLYRSLPWVSDHFSRNLTPQLGASPARK